MKFVKTSVKHIDTGMKILWIFGTSLKLVKIWMKHTKTRMELSETSLKLWDFFWNLWKPLWNILKNAWYSLKLLWNLLKRKWNFLKLLFEARLKRAQNIKIKWNLLETSKTCEISMKLVWNSSEAGYTVGNIPNSIPWCSLIQKFISRFWDHLNISYIIFQFLYQNHLLTNYYTNS